MYSIRLLQQPARLFLAACFLASATLALPAQNNKKASAPPPKPAPAARPAPAPAQRPSGGGSTSASRPSGPSANAGPSANNHAGPTTSGYTTARTTIANPGYRTTTATTASHLAAPGNATTTPHRIAAPAGSHQVQLQSGSSLRTRANGHLSDIHDARRGLDIHHGLDGSRRVSIDRPDHSRLVAVRGRAGYIQRPYSFHNHDFARRTYYFHGRAYDRFYRGYGYRGFALNVYAPGRYYPLGFYGWAYNPWYSPVIYPWGWAGSPWFGYYGGYFAPYPAYPSASFWLTDYMISSDLADQYQAEQETQTLPPAAYPAGGPPVLSPEVKQLVADEVKSELALENAEAQQNAAGQDPDPGSSGIARLLTDGHPHTFVAGDPIDALDAFGTECALSDGDVLELTQAPPPDSPVARLTVLASKGAPDCPRSDNVNLSLSDLQDMQNHMRDRIDQGLQELQQKQGQSGIPRAPASATAPPVETAFAQIAPPPDPSGAAEITQQQMAANQAEQELVAQSQQQTPADAAVPAPPPDSLKPPATIALGQSIDQVTSAFGQPTTVIDLGAKKIYQYKDMKITFKAGKVADVE